MDNEDKKSSEYGNVWSSDDYRKEYYQNYREKNRKRLNEYKKKYCQNNKDKVKNWNQNYYEKNKEKFKLYQKKYQKENREKVNELSRNYKRRKKETEIPHLTESQRTIFFNLRRINKMKNNGKTWDEIALEIGLHRDTLMRALRSGVFSYEKKYILKLKEFKQWEGIRRKEKNI